VQAISYENGMSSDGEPGALFSCILCDYVGNPLRNKLQAAYLGEASNINE